MSNTNRSHKFFLVVFKGLQSVFFSFVYLSWSQLKTCKSWKEIRKEIVDSEFKIGGWHVMNRVQHDDIWNSEFTNISIKKFATLDPTTQNTNRFLSRMITFLAILSTLRDRKEEKKNFAPWHAYHWIIEPHYIHALQGRHSDGAEQHSIYSALQRTHTIKPQQIFPIYLSIAHSFRTWTGWDTA